MRENESVNFKGALGTVPQELKAALEEMAIIAEASRCKNFLYHASINPPEGEHLTPEQWEKAVDILAVKLGLEGHQRAVVEHVKNDRAHHHVVFNRVNPETLKAVRMSHSYRKHEEAAREMEREFSLEHVPNSFDHGNDNNPAPPRGYEQKDFDQARRTKVDPRTVTADLSKLWEQAGSGADFIKEAAALGYVIARGDKRDFVAIDSGGGIHSLAKKAKIKTAAVREKMKDVDRFALPSVDQVREQQQTRAAEIAAQKEKNRAGHRGATLYDSAGMAAQQKDALKHHQDIISERNAPRSAQEMAKDWQRQREAKRGQPAPQHEKAAPDWSGLGGSFATYTQTQAQEPIQSRPRPSRENQPQQERSEPQNNNSGAIGKEKSQAEERRDQKKATTEQTAEQIRQQQREAMREMLERNFGRVNTGTLNHLEQSRGRQRER